jgi:hypothetical protein
VSYSSEGAPVSITLTGEASPTLGWGGSKNGLPTGQKSKVSGSVSTADGMRYVRSYTLDLTRPENRAAFDRAFFTTGPLALPRLDPNPADTADRVSAFVDRLGADAVYVESTYALTESGGTASAKGGEGFVFGGEGTYKTTNTRLEQASARDNGVPGSRLTPLSTCR